MSVFSEVKKSLQARGYEVSEFDTSAEAVNYLSNLIHGKTVGFGGSVTLNDMGLYEALSSDNDVYWHWKCKEGISASETIKKAQSADIYFTSANALSQDGIIVNIDGNCNRVSAMTYGHEKVFFIIGKNKLCNNEQEAVSRSRNTAAPLNAKRLGKKTPCSKNADKCYDCNSPERICKCLSVLWRCSGAQKTEVVLINEALGY